MEAKPKSKAPGLSGQGEARNEDQNAVRLIGRAEVTPKAQVVSLNGT
jgi:hypothetical protein